VGGQALHAVDVLDASTGRLLRALFDANLTTITPLVAPHPRCAGGRRGPVLGFLMFVAAF
jgi:hypothetical protein